MAKPFPPCLLCHQQGNQQAFQLSGSSDQIAAQWNDTLLKMQPGDLLQLAPDGGTLQLPDDAVLVIDKAIVLSGAPLGGSGGADAPQAGEGPATITCGSDVREQVMIRVV